MATAPIEHSSLGTWSSLSTPTTFKKGTGQLRTLLSAHQGAASAISVPELEHFPCGLQWLG